MVIVAVRRATGGPTHETARAVRLGKNGEQEAYALEHSELVLGFKGGNLTQKLAPVFRS